MKERPNVAGSSSPSTPALEEEGAMAEEIQTQTPRVEASKISYSIGNIFAG